MKKICAGITGTGSYLPDRILTNKELEKMVNTSDEWIKTMTGISERRIADPETSSSDVGLVAAQRALEDANLTPEELDLIIVGTISPDMIFPSTACVLQHKLGATKAGAFDLSAGCTGFVYALAIAAQFIEAGTYKNVLVVGAEALNKIIDWEDRNTCVLFGDGAGAAVVQPVEEGRGVLSMELGSDGSGAEFLSLPAGGSKCPATPETILARQHYLQMNGREVFKFAVRVMGESSERVIEKAGLKKEDVDFFIPHQANFRIIESAAKRLGLGMEKVYVNLDKYGNTSAASIGIALDEAIRSGKVKKGDNLVLVGFGAGLTWGSVVLKL